MLFVSCCLWFLVRCVVPVVWWLLCVVRCLLFAFVLVGCLLLVDCSSLVVVVCCVVGGLLLVGCSMCLVLVYRFPFFVRFFLLFDS